MKRILTTIVLTLGLLLLMMPMTVSADSGITVVNKTGDGDWIENTWRVEIFPGEVKSTTLTLYNSSSSSLKVEILLPSSLDKGNITFELNKANFTMSGKSHTYVTLTLKANGGATPGTYTTGLVEIKSEVPPAPSPAPQPAPPLEPEEEPVEPEVVVPTEPVEPEEEEPIEEPIEPIEPVEPIEPEEPEEPLEPEEPVESEDLIPIEEPCRWSLLDSILASLVAIMLGLDIWQWRKQRA